MNDTSGMKKRILPLATALVLGALAMDANARIYAYWQDQNGVMVRSGTGTCVRTDSWTPELATAECDPELMSKTAAVAPADPAPEARAEPEPAPMPVTEKVTMDADAMFDFDKSEIKPKGKKDLDEVVRKLSLAGAELGLIVSTGHTDSTGDAQYNIDLSLRRAEAVKAYLISKGVDSNDITTAGVGESQSNADNTSETGRAKNRRVEIEVSSTRTTQ